MAFVSVRPKQTTPSDALLHLEAKAARHHYYIAHTWIFIKNLLSICDIQGTALGRTVTEVIFRSVVQPLHTLVGSWMFLRYYSLFNSASALRTRPETNADAVMNEPRLGLPQREESSPSPAHPWLREREREGGRRGERERESLAVSLSLSLCLFSSPL